MKLGKAFSDSVILEQKSSLRKTKDVESSWWAGYGRTLIFTTVLCIAFFILVFRLFHLTVIEGHTYRTLADGNRTRELTRHAPRGVLLDRTGKALVANVPQYRLLKPCEGGGKAVPAGRQDCVERMTEEQGKALSVKGLKPGTFLEVDFLRQYLYPDSTSHVLGYIGELSEGELKDDYYSLRLYGRGDKIGRMGAEAVLEDRLRGRDGKELVEVDAAGKILRILGRQEELPGENVSLSLDAAISDAVAKAFPPGKKGAVIVSKPDTGEILALYSSPTFSSNGFSLGMSQSEYNSLIGNPDRPMFDRAIGGVYPPGSTFKIVSSLAGLEERAITKDTLVEDTGVLKIGPYSFPNWFFLQYGKTDGMVDLPKALQRSNDIYFYKLGEALGITKFNAWMRKVGIGKPLGIELAGEASGLVPDPAWKASQFDTKADKLARNDQWYLGDTYHVSIGQGYLLTTPLQVNAWTNIVANGGKLCRPTIQKITSVTKAHCEDLHIKKETLALITEGMKRACESGGTGWPLFEFKVQSEKLKVEDEQAATPSASFVRVPVACKTGTAEFGDADHHTHAWFTVFAPFPPAAQSAGLPEDAITGNPEISITVLVEEAGEGSDHAAPIAKKILEEWFRR